jgi:hypothetical protein
MKNQTNAPADRTRQPVPPMPAGPNVTVHQPVKPFTVRETDTEGDTAGIDGYQGAR